MRRVGERLVTDGIFAMCSAAVFGLIIGPGALGVTILIERYIDSCPDGSEPPDERKDQRP